jgi:hypothetical protein
MEVRGVLITSGDELFKGHLSEGTKGGCVISEQGANLDRF